MRGGSVLAVLRSATTAPWPSSGRTTPGAGTGGEGGSTGMVDSFYRVDALQSQAWHIELAARSASPGNASRGQCKSSRDGRSGPASQSQGYGGGNRLDSANLAL